MTETGASETLGTGASPDSNSGSQNGAITPGQPHEGSRITQDGRIISVPPDVCLTPRGSAMVPVPYKIWAYQKEATDLANTVLQTTLRSHVKGSKIRQCFGDEAGTGGGIKSGTTGAECTPKTWSQTVLWEGRNAVRDSDEWWMNKENTWGILDYKKDTNQYNTPASNQVDPKMYLASTAAIPAAEGGGWAGDAAAAAGRYGATALNYGSKVVGFIGEGGALVTGGLAGAFLLGSTGSTASPEMDQPFPHGIPPSTPAEPQPTSPPPSTPAAQLPTSPPPSTVAEQQPTSPPPSTAAEQQPTSPPPSTPAEDTGPQVMESRPLSQWKIQNKVDPNAVRQTHAKNPCASLQKGQNGGGSYGGVKGHHMPADAISTLPEPWGPAIQMDQPDHAELSSTGARSTSQGMSAQGALAQQDFMKAFDNDAAEVQNLFPGKYDAKIAEARAYAECLTGC